ncbi:hypothetical protein M409DRAFT_58829 [Zasmidium cellare ATCC 36951]|uniref:Uncharacterized protein n=1 Tax=Zasmidium cellare ATCC 36951 TaxID=1080233 RepID=A0A6A6C779_ZASCE|nr:uncharacterized protein M409DRAFT_58829 [Zasmidium cellare ATCC 36951]KAF2161752.1 hypothetical protein M409DRAFT_58829 [Zasmidium cellare ATCC 36951]
MGVEYTLANEAIIHRIGISSQWVPTTSPSSAQSTQPPKKSNNEQVHPPPPSPSTHQLTTPSPKKILSLLQKSAREYYSQASSKCTTWSYFLPFPPPKKPDTPLLIGGLEIYTDKNALQKQIDDPVYFQSFQEIVKKEGLCVKEDELVAWYLTEGFVARGEHARPFGGNLISLSRSFVPFVKEKEPFVLTYAVFTRPKAPKELLLYVRYTDSKGMQSHSKAPEHVEVVKEIMKHTEGHMSKSTTIWKEVDDSFVSTVEGGPTDSSKL